MLQQAISNPGRTRYSVLATVREVKQTEFSATSGKPFQRVQLDDGQTQRQVKIFQGNGQPLTQQHVGQRLQFQISGYVSTFDSQVYLSGFWNSNANVQQGQPVQTPPIQAPHPAPNKPPAQSQAKNGDLPNTTFALACAKDLVVSKDIDLAQQYTVAKNNLYFLNTGEIPESGQWPNLDDGEPEGNEPEPPI